jgi:exopolyphosphatase/guanosine-5'-triphosphate,3'-diphosphate pyrophosphatase
LDIGTHSTLLLLARATPDGDIIEEKEWFRVTRLGAGLTHTGRLDADAVERTLRTIDRFLGELPTDRPLVGVAAATAAVREAENSALFLERCAGVVGGEPRLLSGQEEARTTFLGAASDQAPTARVVTVDVGGGSTEMAVGTKGRCWGQTSLDLGCVRLAETYGLFEPPSDADLRMARQQIRRRLRPGLLALRQHVPDLETANLVLSGGTATTYAALRLGLADYDRERVHGYEGRRAQLLETVERLLGLSSAARAALPGVHRDRAPVLPAGLLIIACLLEACGSTAFRVTTRGLRAGLVLRLLRGEIPAVWTQPGSDDGQPGPDRRQTP